MNVTVELKLEVVPLGQARVESHYAQPTKSGEPPSKATPLLPLTSSVVTQGRVGAV